MGPRGRSAPPEGSLLRRAAVAAVLLVTAIALLPLTATAQGDGGPLPVADLPPLTPAAAAPAPPLLPPAMAEPEATTASVPPSLMEKPGGAFFDPWLDVPHAFIERRIFDVAYGFDRFFSDERDLDNLRPNSFLRWRNEVAVRDDGSFDFATGVRADITLPYLQKRLRRFRVVLENAGRGLAGSDPRAIAGQGEGGRGDAVVQWTLLDTLRSSVSLGGGVLFALPPGVVGRARFRYARELGPVALARVGSTGFWNTKDGFGFDASVSFERSLAKPLLLRWTTGTLVSQVSHGYESASSVSLLAKVGRVTAITLTGSAVGHSKPEREVTAWRVATRLRTGLYRRWIYGEVEPEVRWPLDAAGGRRPVSAIMFRLELQFEEAPPADVSKRGAPVDAARAAPG